MDRPWLTPFLTAVAAGSSLSEAARAAGVPASTVYRLRKEDADFQAALADAEEESVDILETEARRRAVTGVEEPVFHQGVICGHKTVYSDSLLTLLLKGRRKLFATDRTELTGANGGPLKVDDTTRAARIAALMQIAEQRKRSTEGGVSLDDLV